MARQIFEGLEGGKYGRLGEYGQRLEARFLASAKHGAAIWKVQTHGFWKESGRMGPKTELRRVWKAQKQGFSKFGTFEIKGSKASGSEIGSRRRRREEIGRNSIEASVNLYVYGEVLNGRQSPQTRGKVCFDLWG